MSSKSSKTKTKRALKKTVQPRASSKSPRQHPRLNARGSSKLLQAFGPRLKALRESRGLKTQADAANKCGIGLPVFHTYETGKCLPSASALVLLARGLKTTTDKLLGL